MRRSSALFGKGTNSSMVGIPKWLLENALQVGNEWAFMAGPILSNTEHAFIHRDLVAFPREISNCLIAFSRIMSI